MTALDLLLWYALPLLVCLMAAVAAIREDGYLRMDELAKFAVVALCPFLNIIGCIWLAVQGLTLMGDRINWSRVIWRRKEKSRP